MNPLRNGAAPSSPRQSSARAVGPRRPCVMVGTCCPGRVQAHAAGPRTLCRWGRAARMSSPIAALPCGGPAA